MRGAGIRTAITTRDPRNWPAAYRLRWTRRRLLWAALRARHDLAPLADRTGAIRPGDILAFLCVRNEAERLPHFLRHYRRLGVRHFLVVDNASDDASRDLVSGERDVSLWTASAPYRAAGFGRDWLAWLRLRHGHGHWCLTLDADELLIYPFHDTRPLFDLVAELSRAGMDAMGALMLDLYPRGGLGTGTFHPGQDPLDVLDHFDAGPYRTRRQRPAANLCVQGGPRDRVFFADDPRRAPTLNKLPLVKWNRRFAYLNSTHSMLPPRLNHLWDGPGDHRLSGALLHTKFLPSITARADEELVRRQHFGDPDAFGAYHRAITEGPSLWHPGAVRYRDWRQIEDLGIMSRGAWQ